jgi:hypothetical protein
MGMAGGLTGTLLWPAVAVHGVVTLLLAGSQRVSGTTLEH